MLNNRIGRWSNHPFVRDYGMIFILLLLAAMFSLLTVKHQHPTGSEAGKQVAELIVQSYGPTARVLIVTRDIEEDRAFGDACQAALETSGCQVLARVAGSAPDTRLAIERLINDGETIDAVAANQVTSQWTVYDRFPQVGSQKCVVPRSYIWPDFLKMSNLIGVANQTSIYAIIAIGMTMVIVTGGIDLSVGSLVALSAVITAILIRDGCGGTAANSLQVFAAALAGIGCCALAGAFNGWFITKFRMAPFIVTLGMMMIASGLAFRLSHGHSIPEVPTSFLWLGGGKAAGIPHPVLLMLGLYGIAHFAMSRTIFGRYVYAIGGNEEAARLSGVPVRRVLLMVYTLCGTLAGLGGIVLASQLSAGDPKFGLMYELEVIAAVVVGGTSLMGGKGKIFGTLIGAFIIAMIKNGMNLLNIDPFNQKIVLGTVLIAAVLLDTAKRNAGF